MDYCENGVLANGFLLKAEKDQGSGDDTGANAVCLQCDDMQRCSSKGSWGEWLGTIGCPKGSYSTGWRQNVEDRLVLRDDTALDNVEYICRDIESWRRTKKIKAKAEEWGRWNGFQECKVEINGDDDAALR